MGVASEIERKSRIARAAEHLFSRQEFDAVSIRDIATQAGVNSALVGYHFGTKDELYRALFARRYHDITEKRLAELDKVRFDAGAPSTLLGIIRAWTGPLLELASSEDGRDFAALLARQSNATSDHWGVWRDYMEPSASVCLGALRRALPNASVEEVLQAYLWMIASLMSCVSMTARESRLLQVIQRPAQEPLARARSLEIFLTQGFVALLCPALGQDVPPRSVTNPGRGKRTTKQRIWAVT